MKTRSISHLSPSEIEAAFAHQADEIAQLKQQLDWLKRQLFGRKSEKMLADNPAQSSLFDEGETLTLPAETKPVKAHTRSSQKQRRDSDLNDEGLRFDETVPQLIIDVPAPELQGADADQYDVVDIKETRRLAQQPGSYVVLVYRRQVVRHKTTQTIKDTPAPGNVLEGCYCDVSLLAGLMVDKAVYHLPLHRQHQRMLDSGITLSRATLINWIQKGIELLRPIAKAQWQHILQSKILAMDEVPIKAGRTKGAGDIIATLYRHEKHIRHKQLDLADIHAYRKQHSEPLVTDFFRWVYQQRQRTDLLPKSPFAKALHYAHERESQLKVFLSNPALPMDTNHLERALRVIPIGRKNYLFCWSELGAEQLGILQSLMVTCRLQGVNPYHYLVDVLQRVALHPARDVIDLTPRLWKQKYNQNRLVSDVKILTSQH